MAMTDTPVRRATEADIPAMAQIIFDWETATDWVPDTYSLKESEDFIRTVMPDREIWVSGEPVKGYLSFDPKAQRIGMLYCSERGKGVGKALLDQVKAGRGSLWLTTQECNLPAQRFYKREGFVEAGPYDAGPPNQLPEIRMEWQV
ncbi:GNAT family N-acetyltransferase [Leisingera sp. ANG-Vp]|uniref:GNAT family N-acetyltransferase n=1 Tax=Leisingera sp. ANG-Vp TaxID=1577896 RepID=UPI001F4D20F6|nr:GNAT family N-acetyltransferase [Leisingera sp. ANG-Vp]